jgi:hypothetical protein
VGHQAAVLAAPGRHQKASKHHSEVAAAAGSCPHHICHRCDLSAFLPPPPALACSAIRMSQLAFAAWSTTTWPSSVSIPPLIDLVAPKTHLPLAHPFSAFFRSCSRFSGPTLPTGSRPHPTTGIPSIHLPSWPLLCTTLLYRCFAFAPFSPL